MHTGSWWEISSLRPWWEISSLRPLAGILSWHRNMAAFMNTSTRGWQLNSAQATKVFSFQLATLVLFAPGLLSAISVVFFTLVISFLISMCHDHLVNWPVSLSLISYFRKPMSSLSIKLLATKASVLLTTKSICHIPIYQQYNIPI